MIGYELFRMDIDHAKQFYFMSSFVRCNVQVDGQTPYNMLI
jgi:hypothetical protein